MDKNRVIVTLFSILLIILLIITFTLGRKSVDIPEVKTEIEIDTVYKEKPVPYKVETIKTVYIPKNNCDNSNKEKENNEEKTDSIPIDIKKKVYQDSTYRAIISGPTIGEFEPILEEITIYSNTVIKKEKSSPHITPYISMSFSRSALGIGGGLEFNNRISFGIKYVQLGNNNTLLAELNYKF